MNQQQRDIIHKYAGIKPPAEIAVMVNLHSSNVTGYCNRHGLDHRVIKNCIVCGTPLNKRRLKFCSATCLEIDEKKRRTMITHNPLNRPFSIAIKRNICIWHAEGDSIKTIADVLNRSEKSVEKMIYECQKNGTYAEYTKYTQYRKKEKRKCK